MTTPAINTPFAVITDALGDCGLLSAGVTPSGELLASSLRRLRDVINTAQLKGLKLWLQTDLSIALVASRATYTLGPGGTVNMTKPLQVISGYFADNSTPASRRPLNPLAWADYTQLGQVANTGAINSYFVDRQQTLLRVTFWPVPDATAALGTAHLIIRQQAVNPTELDETLNFPEEWRMYLRWALAADMATGQPQAVIDRCEQKAAMYEELLTSWDIEDAPTTITPDTQMAYPTNSFV